MSRKNRNRNTSVKNTAVNSNQIQHRNITFTSPFGNVFSQNHIDTDNANSLSTVFVCEKIISESIAMLPLILYKNENGQRTVYKDHPLYKLLYISPNKDMTSFDLRSTMILHALRYGNGFAQKVFNELGELVAIYPLHASRMGISRDSEGNLIYTYTRTDNTKRIFLADEIWHIKINSSDGIVGLSPINLVRNAFATANAIETYQTAFFENGAIPSGIITAPTLLDEDAALRIEQNWNAAHQGSKNSNKVTVLENGVTYTPIKNSMIDQDFINQRKFNQAQIAAIYRIPVHMLNDSEQSSYSSLEESLNQFVSFTLQPLLVSFEQSIIRCLVPEDEQDTVYAKHKLQSLLRGNAESRSEFYNKGLMAGWLSINQVLELEDMNPIENGDVRFVPLNMVTLDNAVKPTVEQRDNTLEIEVRSIDVTKPVETTEVTETSYQTRSIQSQKEGIAKSQKYILQDASNRMVKREIRDLRQLIEKVLRKKGLAEFKKQLADFYSNGDFSKALSDAFTPIIKSISEQVLAVVGDELNKDTSATNLDESISEYIDIFVREWIKNSSGQLEFLIEASQDNQQIIDEMITERLSEWEETKADKITEQQQNESVNVLSVAAYALLGVKVLKWLANKGACTFCQKMDGKTVSVNGYFLKSGDNVDSGNEELGVMKINKNFKNPPMHIGCGCNVVAG